jgi:hypothetical protein
MNTRTTNAVAAEHSINHQVELHVFDPLTRKSNWDTRGTVQAVVTATDRKYRVNVLGEDGRLFESCAPECVRAIGAPA